jgi:class 3 adenylate cyclase/DNA-binding transcriptional MerR regulator
LLTSKEIIERTGISRATLNNYIASGLVPRPQVLPPGPEHGAAPRIGYFPDETFERIETIQRLKREGWSIARIGEQLSRGGPMPAAPQSEAHRPTAAPAPLQQDLGLAAPRTSSPSPAPSHVPAPAPFAATGMGSPVPRPPEDRPRSREVEAWPPAAPQVTPVAVLVGNLQDAAGLWIKLSAQEYFELVNEVWAEIDRILRRHRARPGRIAGELMVCYFLAGEGGYLWNALAAAHQTREAMRQLSHRWQLRKGWDLDLCINIGIAEGQEWMGAIGTGAQSELRVLGDAVDHAEHLAAASRAGTILVTRSLLGRLSGDERQRVTYGVSRRDTARGEAPLLFTFARLEEIAGPQPIPPHLAGLPVAELLDLTPTTPPGQCPERRLIQ